MSKFRAFSLAETLTALGIIGVLCVTMLLLNSMSDNKYKVATTKIAQVDSALKSWGKAVSKTNETGLGAAANIQDEENLTQSLTEYFKNIGTKPSEDSKEIILNNGVTLNVKYTGNTVSLASDTKSSAHELYAVNTIDSKIAEIVASTKISNSESITEQYALVSKGIIPLADLYEGWSKFEVKAKLDDKGNLLYKYYVDTDNTEHILPTINVPGENGKTTTRYVDGISSGTQAEHGYIFIKVSDTDSCGYNQTGTIAKQTFGTADGAIDYTVNTCCNSPKMYAGINADGTNKCSCQKGSVDIPAGYKFAENDECKAPCLEGSYEKDGICKLCGIGKYCPNEAQTSQINCPKGSYCPNNTSKKINSDYNAEKYLDKNGKPATKNSNIFTVKNGGLINKVTCPAGYYCKNENMTAATKCLKGTYCPNKGMTDPIKCPAGTYGTNDGATSIADCLPCTAGNYCPNAGMSVTDLVNFICDSDYGKFSASGATACSVCPAGQFLDKNELKCKPCSKGSYSDRAGMAGECTKCPPGTIQPKEGQTSCVACASGASTADRLFCGCPKGQYFDSKTKNCQPCAIDTYGDTVGLIDSCKPCPDGTSNETTGATSQSACGSCPDSPDGALDFKIVSVIPPATWAVIVNGCPNGTSAATYDQLGLIADVIYGAEEAECTVNSASTTKYSNCKAAIINANPIKKLIEQYNSYWSANHYAKNSAFYQEFFPTYNLRYGSRDNLGRAGICVKPVKKSYPNCNYVCLPPKKYDAKTNACVCQKSCDAHATLNQQNCKCECNPGYYLNNGKCVACSVGTYQDEKGQASCKQCPDNSTTTGSGASSISKCKCNAGFALYDNNNNYKGFDNGQEGSFSNENKNTFKCARTDCAYYSKANDNKEYYCGDEAAIKSKIPSGANVRDWVYGESASASSNACHIRAAKQIFTDTLPNHCGITNCDANATVGVSGGALKCICNAGFYGNGDTCTACPANSTSPAGSTSRNACQCNAGYSGDATKGSCTPCTGDTYKDTVGNTACTPCPDGATTKYTDKQTGQVVSRAAGSHTRLTVCQCKQGYKVKDGATTSDGGFKPGLASNAYCEACTGDTYKDTINNGACKACPNGSTTKKMENGQVVDRAVGSHNSILRCQCKQGYKVKEGATTSDGGFKAGLARDAYCEACDAGTFKTTINNNVCKACPANSSTKSKGTTDIAQCKCNAGYALYDNSNSQKTFAGYKDGKEITFNDTNKATYRCMQTDCTYFSGANSNRQYYCGDVSNIKNQLPSGANAGDWVYAQAASADSNACQIRTANEKFTGERKCSIVQCPANSTATADGLSCVCNEGYYGNGNTSCTKCPEGTFTDTKGSSKCTPCPENSSTETEGTTNIAQCKCKGGYAVYTAADKTYKGVKNGKEATFEGYYINSKNKKTVPKIDNTDVACKQTNCAYFSGENSNRHYYCGDVTAIKNQIPSGANVSDWVYAQAASADSKSSCKVREATERFTDSNSPNHCGIKVCDINATVSEEAFTLGSSQTKRKYTKCICNAGYYGNGDTCTACPPYSTSPAGSTSKNDCQCNAGYGGDARKGSCTPCTGDTYKDTIGNTACISCPVGATTKKMENGQIVDRAVGSHTRLTVCQCGQGYKAKDEAIYPADHAQHGTFKPGLAKNAYCEACGTAFYEDRIGNYRNCRACPAESHTAQAAATDIAQCKCKGGYITCKTANANGVCTTTAGGANFSQTSKPELTGENKMFCAKSFCGNYSLEGSNNQIYCGDAFTGQTGTWRSNYNNNNASSEPFKCPYGDGKKFCPQVVYAPAGSAQEDACELRTNYERFDGTGCAVKECVNATPSADGNSCICNAGYYGDGNTCSPCPVGTYKTAAGNGTKEEKCTPCPPGTSGGDGVGMTSIDSCTCPYYEEVYILSRAHNKTDTDSVDKSYIQILVDGQGNNAILNVSGKVSDNDYEQNRKKCTDADLKTCNETLDNLSDADWNSLLAGEKKKLTGCSNIKVSPNTICFKKLDRRILTTVTMDTSKKDALKDDCKVGRDLKLHVNSCYKLLEDQYNDCAKKFNSGDYFDIAVRTDIEDKCGKFAVYSHSIEPRRNTDNTSDVFTLEDLIKKTLKFADESTWDDTIKENKKLELVRIFFSRKGNELHAIRVFFIAKKQNGKYHLIDWGEVYDGAYAFGWVKGECDRGGDGISVNRNQAGCTPAEVEEKSAQTCNRNEGDYFSIGMCPYRDIFSMPTDNTPNYSTCDKYTDATKKQSCIDAVRTTIDQFIYCTHKGCWSQLRTHTSTDKYFYSTEGSSKFNAMDRAVTGAHISSQSGGWLKIKDSNNGYCEYPVSAFLKLESPLILDLLGNGKTLTSLKDGVIFDLNADGFAERTAWTDIQYKFDDAFLCLDRNNNGIIDDGGELFGNQHGEANGFDELAKFDDNKDEQITPEDKVFNKLKLWVDFNKNGKVDYITNEDYELFNSQTKGGKNLSLNENMVCSDNNICKYYVNEKRDICQKEKGVFGIPYMHCYTEHTKREVNMADEKTGKTFELKSLDEYDIVSVSTKYKELKDENGNLLRDKHGNIVGMEGSFVQRVKVAAEDAYDATGKLLDGIVESAGNFFKSVTKSMTDVWFMTE